MKNLYKIFIGLFLFSIITSKSFSSPIENEVCNIFSHIYESCKIDLSKIKDNKKSITCNELALNTAFYFDKFFESKSKKGKNFSKLLGEVCFEACMGKEHIYTKIKENFCK